MEADDPLRRPTPKGKKKGHGRRTMKDIEPKNKINENLLIRCLVPAIQLITKLDIIIHDDIMEVGFMMLRVYSCWCIVKPTGTIIIIINS